MNWKYIIIDRNGNPHEIDEPVGWDANEAEIKRHPSWHGIFISTQGDTFQFDGEAMRLLKAEYEQYGVAGVMTLVLEEDCGNGYEEFYRGQFDFGRYIFICSDECYVTVPVEMSGETVTLMARYDQKVNLEATTAFDEITVLPAYDKLPFDLQLPSKGIVIKDIAETKALVAESFDGGLQAVQSGGYNLTNHQIAFGFDNTKAAEIGSFSVPPSHIASISTQSSGAGFTGNTFSYFPGTQSFGSDIWPLSVDYNPIVNFSEGSANYNDFSNPCELTYYVSGSLRVLNCYVGNVQLFLLRLPDSKDAANGELLAHYNVLHVDTFNLQSLNLPNNLPATGYKGPSDIISFTSSFTDAAFQLNKGDRLYFFLHVFERKGAAQITAVNGGAKAFSLSLDAGSYFKLTDLSKTQATTSKVFAINETISRITESITNGKLRAYSKYFGRTDSKPYRTLADGCGSMEVLTDGLRIRRQESKITGQTTAFSLSLQDVFEGLNPIHNIGMGIEPDPARPGSNRLRVEPWEYFYSNDVIFSCTGINKITRKVNSSEIYSTFQFGYNKWEAEEYTGLDEFLTKRTGRTTLSNAKNALVKLTNWIGSGYAAEVTRRKGNDDSKDWRYDKDTFIICVKRGGIEFLITYVAPHDLYVLVPTSGDLDAAVSIFEVGKQFKITDSSNAGTYTVVTSGIVTTGLYTGQFLVTVAETLSTSTTTHDFFSRSGFVVELGGIDSPQNIIDPDTVYNYRISPIRMALRWINKVFRSYRQFDVNSKLIFTDGDGNYFASGELSDADCKLESGPIAENATISPAIYADPNAAKPFMYPERVVYEYPMNSQDYKQVKANPKGLIYFESGCEDGYGWIDTINYRPEESLATFTLIPKIV